MTFRIIEKRTSDKTYYRIQELVTKKHLFIPDTQEWVTLERWNTWDDWVFWETEDFEAACKEKQLLEAEAKHEHELKKATWVVTTRSCCEDSTS